MSSHRIISDPYALLADMQKNGSYVVGEHIVCEDNAHSEEHLDKDTYLQNPKVAENVVQLLVAHITPGSIIIAPETRSNIILGERVAQLTQSRFISTIKVNGTHTFPKETLSVLLQGKHPRILVDDIFNNGETFAQVSNAMTKMGVAIDEICVMVDRNPENSSQLGVPVASLAQLQINQWNEKDVPDWLKAKPISTKLGKSRNWTPKTPGEMIAYKFFLERIGKQNLEFTFDDGMVVKQFDQDGFMLRLAKNLAEKFEEGQ